MCIEGGQPKDGDGCGSRICKLKDHGMKKGGTHMEVAILKHSQRKLLFLCHKMLIRKESLNRLTVYVIISR